jgi:hypothetical protein
MEKYVVGQLIDLSDPKRKTMDEATLTADGRFYLAGPWEPSASFIFRGGNWMTCGEYVSEWASKPERTEEEIAAAKLYQASDRRKLSAVTVDTKWSYAQQPKRDWTVVIIVGVSALLAIIVALIAIEIG